MGFRLLTRQINYISDYKTLFSFDSSCKAAEYTLSRFIAIAETCQLICRACEQALG